KRERDDRDDDRGDVGHGERARGRTGAPLPQGGQRRSAARPAPRYRQPRGALPFYDLLARNFTVYLPSHPGYEGSERPNWLRNVRDVAVIYQSLLAERGLTGVSLLGLGFGGWIAAEMATMAPAAFR